MTTVVPIKFAVAVNGPRVYLTQQAATKLNVVVGKTWVAPQFGYKDKLQVLILRRDDRVNVYTKKRKGYIAAVRNKKIIEFRFSAIKADHMNAQPCDAELLMNGDIRIILPRYFHYDSSPFHTPLPTKKAELETPSTPILDNGSALEKVLTVIVTDPELVPRDKIRLMERMTSALS